MKNTGFALIKEISQKLDMGEAQFEKWFLEKVREKGLSPEALEVSSLRVLVHELMQETLIRMKSKLRSSS